MSAEGLKAELRDGILVITLAHPPLNALSPALRAALVQAVTGAPDECRGIVLTAEGPAFSAHHPLEPDHECPSLSDLCRAVAESRFPVVAVLHGLVTGPGAELALAARARIAAPSLRLAFPEVTPGLCSAGGATRRLPLLIGAQPALGLLLSGRAVPASEALSLGLIDGITESAPAASAIRLAGVLAVGDLLCRPEPDAAAWTASVAAARREAVGRMPAARKIIDCVESALLLPEPAADAFEAVARADLEATPEAAGLIAAARAELRALALPPVLARVQPLSVNRIGLLGTAPDLARLAVAALSREVSVLWAFPDEAARATGLAAVEAGINQGLRTGRLLPERAQAMRGRITATEELVQLTSTPLLVTDRLLGGSDGWGGLPGAAELVLGGVEGEMGLVLAPMGRACEVTLPPEALPLARATALAGLKRIGVLPLQVDKRPVLGARMADAGRTALAWMVSRGVPRRLITSTLEQFGLRTPDPVSVEVPAVARAMPAVEVLNRWLAALANEGARLLDEGIARRPSDIDHLMVSGYQFPRWQGGPMHQADRRGLMVLRHDLRAWGAEAALWSPAPLIDRLIRDGKGFAALDG